MICNKKTELLQVRLTEKEKNKIRGLAKIYADGDISTWVRWASLNAERKFLKKKTGPENQIFRAR